MVTIADPPAFELWLKDRSSRDSLAIANRAALRVAQAFWQWHPGQREHNTTAFPMLRLLFVAGVALKHPTREIQQAVAAAAAVAETAAHNAHQIAVASVQIAVRRHIRAADESALSVAGVAAAFFADENSLAEFAAKRVVTHSSTVVVSAREQGSLAVGLPFEINTTFWSNISADCSLVEAHQDPSLYPLWAAAPLPAIEENWLKARASFAEDPGKAWAFWTRWWDAVLAGAPLDWALQHDIALIPDAVWQAGPGPVAEAIAGIEERFDLRAQVAVLKDQLRRSTLVAVQQPASPAHRSHNQPPELLEVETNVRREITIIWAALDEAETELAKDAPSSSVLRRVGAGLVDAAKRLLSSLTSEAITSAKKAVVASALSVLVVAAAPYANRVIEIGKALIDFATKLLGGS